MRRPSGDHVGWKISPSSGKRMRRSTRPLAPSITESTGRPRLAVAMTKRSPSGLHSPAEWMKPRFWISGSTALRVRACSTLPVTASAR